MATLCFGGGIFAEHRLVGGRGCYFGLIGNRSPIYTVQKKWVWTHKKIGIDQMFLPRKPSVQCFLEMDPDSLFSSFGAIARPKKKTTPDPFCCS